MEPTSFDYKEIKDPSSINQQHVEFQEAKMISKECFLGSKGLLEDSISM